MRIRTTLVIMLACSTLCTSPSWAQRADTPADQHVAGPAQLRQALATQLQTDQHNRDSVMAVLQQPQVRQMASRLGLNVMRAEDAVSALSSAELAQAAATSRTVAANLAGGSTTVVVSLTTLLLIIIIVILLV